MALIACTECSKERSTSAKACPHCGHRIKKTKWWLWTPIGLFALFLCWGLYLNNTPEGQAKLKSSRAIEFCYSESKKLPNPALGEQFCQNMANEHINRYGNKP